MKKTRRMMRRNFDKISISRRFLHTPPKPEKMQTKIDAYIDTGKLSPIVVDESMTLVDGYCTYLMAQNYEAVRRKVKIYMRKGG
ncbi:MAG: hypothetical protein NC110_05450 [Ruminococcus sp.]|nr:hypothetical protein [Ruminococcus sp.]